MKFQGGRWCARVNEEQRRVGERRKDTRNSRWKEKNRMSVREEVRMRDKSWKIYIIRNWQRNPSSIRYTRERGGGGADNSKTSPYSCMSKSHTHAYMTTYNIWIGGACYSDHLSLLISESVIEKEIRRQEINRWTPVVSLFIFQCLFPFLPPLFAELRLHEYLNKYGAARVNMFTSSPRMEGLKRQCLIVV